METFRCEKRKKSTDLHVFNNVLEKMFFQDRCSERLALSDPLLALPSWRALTGCKTME